MYSIYIYMHARVHKYYLFPNLFSSTFNCAALASAWAPTFGSGLFPLLDGRLSCVTC